MSFIAANQLQLLILFFCLGALGTGFLFRKPAGHRAWRLADLVWVLLGGFGALAAVIAGLYTEDSSRLDRQIDIAFGTVSVFERDAARFRLRFCDPPHDTDIAVVCEKVEFLSASTARNADLPLFLSVTREVAPLHGLNFFFSSERRDDMEGMAAAARSFDPEPFLVCTTTDEETEVALAHLRRRIPTIAGDYVILALSYDELIEQITKLRDEYAILQDNAHLLTLQIIALCLVCFAAPFRLGKSLVELRWT